MAHIETVDGTTMLVDTWYTEDVMAAAADMDVIITTEDAEDILCAVANSHDCNIGITWEVLYSHIGMLKEKQNIATMAQSVLDRKKGKN